jgi:hypothetical protein
MIKETQYVKLRKEYNSSGDKSMSSLKSGMNRKTGSKYLKLGKSPLELKQPHTWRTRKDPFEDVIDEVHETLNKAEELEPLIIFEKLQEKYPNKFHDGQLRTLERRVKAWKLQHGKSKLLSFPQVHTPGELMELDWTCMNKLEITISGELFKHKLCHTILTYSNWEWAEIAYSENFLSLKKTFQSTIYNLGSVPKILQMDNSSTATHNVKKGKKARELNESYSSLLDHYKVKSRMINVNSPDENGDIESANGHLKKKIDQYLRYRGSRDFLTIEDYDIFLKEILCKVNAHRAEKVKIELDVMHELPVVRLPEYSEEDKMVNSFGMIRVKTISYSLPSKLKGSRVRVRVYDDVIKVFSGRKELAILPRKRGTGYSVDYRHIIESLRRKPGAFANCQYKNQLFPSDIYFTTYELLKSKYNELRADKEYIQILYFAFKHGEEKVANILQGILEEHTLLTMDTVKAKLNIQVKIPHINIPKPSLLSFDKFLSKVGGLVCLVTPLF